MHYRRVEIKEEEEGGARGVQMISSEYCSRGTVLTLLERSTMGLSPRTALTLLKGVLGAVVHAHRHDVVHGGLNIECACIAPSGSVRVKGFGFGGGGVEQFNNNNGEYTNNNNNSFLTGSDSNNNIYQGVLSAIGEGPIRKNKYLECIPPEHDHTTASASAGTLSRDELLQILKKGDSWAVGIILLQMLCRIIKQHTASSNKRGLTTNKASDCRVFYKTVCFGDDGQDASRTVVDAVRMIRTDNRLLKLPGMVKLLLAALLDTDVSKRLSCEDGLRLCERALKMGV